MRSADGQRAASTYYFSPGSINLRFATWFGSLLRSPPGRALTAGSPTAAWNPTASRGSGGPGGLRGVRSRPPLPARPSGLVRPMSGHPSPSKAAAGQGESCAGWLRPGLLSSHQPSLSFAPFKIIWTHHLSDAGAESLVCALFASWSCGLVALQAETATASACALVLHPPSSPSESLCEHLPYLLCSSLWCGLRVRVAWIQLWKDEAVSFSFSHLSLSSPFLVTVIQLKSS